MYVPSHFSAPEAIGWRIAAEHPFGMLIVPPEPQIAHLPFVVEAGPRRILGHVARANEIADHLDGAELRVVFRGPHDYITPRWYAHPTKQVPTWSYVAALAIGRARTLRLDEVIALFDRLSEQLEPPDGWRTSWIDPSFRDSLAKGVVGFAIEVETMQAKLKISQNRSVEDRRRVLAALEERDPDDALAAWMREFTPMDR